VYKKGNLNGAADALSRKPVHSSEVYAAMTVQPTWLDKVVDSYSQDPFVQEKLQQLAVDPSSATDYSFSDGLLRYQKRIWVGRNTSLRQQIVLAFHSSPLGGHSGFPVTYRRLISLFKWPGMKQDVKTFVSNCHICQQAKPERTLPAGLLQPLPVPSGPWAMATLDFIDGLPTSRQFNCIMVVVDKFSKYAHFIPLKHPYTAATVADLFVDSVYRLHGMPKMLVSDRDPVFTSKFWQGVLKATGTELNMSTAYHPQTDGQTERVNQSIECYLRCFISAHPNQWSKWLSLCEFWYNNNWHSSVGKTPFEVIYGRQPRFFGVTASDSIAEEDVQSWLSDRQLVIASVRQHLLRMQQRMKHQADKHRSERSFSVGDEVFLKLQPYVQSSVARRANHKLVFKFFGPFTVIQRIGEVAYKLKLPDSSRIHPVFHVSQLKPCIGPKHQVLPQLPDADSVFQVPIQVLQRRVRQAGLRTVVQVLVQWSGAPTSSATWEDMEELQQRFPHAPAWGQAGEQEGGNVSNLASQGANHSNAVTPGDRKEPRTRPTRTRKLPGWLLGPQWAK
jgi:hypothetical protein